MYKIVKRLLNTIFSIITLFCITITIIQMSNPKVIERIFGIKIYIISNTRSMEPYLMHNDLVIVKNVNFDELVIDDIIAFSAKNKSGLEIVITHQIIDIAIGEDNERYIKTKGINIKYADINYVTKNGINDTNKYIGKCICVNSYLGKLLEYIKTPLGSIMLVANIMGIMLIYYIYNWNSNNEVEEK